MSTTRFNPALEFKVNGDVVLEGSRIGDDVRVGDDQVALRHCRIARQLRPESQAIAALLAQLVGAAPAP
jgi:hypothetical protein